MTTRAKTTLVQTVVAGLKLFAEPGQAVELRVPKVDGRRNRIDRGYFDDIEKLAQAALAYDGRANGVYFTINPVNPDLLARAYNRVEEWAGTSTSDKDILRRKILYVDIDPDRPAGISSTDEEHEQAIQRAYTIRDWLSRRGWPEPVVGDSGNGARLDYRIDLPNDNDARDLVKKCLTALAITFDDESVHIDTEVENAARIAKVYGTLATKGDDIPSRPHRRSQILEAPSVLEAVPTAQLEDLAKSVPESPQRAHRQNGRPKSGREFVEDFIRQHRIGVAKEAPWQLNGYKWSLADCPFSTAHSDGAYICVLPSGAIAAGCHHNSCQGHDWHSLREMYEGPKQSISNTPSMSKPAQPSTQKADTDKDASVGAIHLTDLGNARRLVARHGHNLHFVPKWNKWLVWNGERWEIDETGLIDQKAKETVATMYAEASEVEDDSARQKLVKHALGSESAYKLKAMVKVAQTEPGVPLMPDELDSDPWLLNVQNGVLNLQTGELYTHSRDDLITKQAAVVFDPDAKCPLWFSFLDRIMAGNQALIEFLQRAVGYTLTGITTEQCLFFMYGTGSNGKSTFTETLTAMLDDYSQKAPTEMLMTQHSGGIPNDVARLPGARHVVVAEVESGRTLAESLVKDLTGGDTMVARFLHQEFFEFVPTHKLWMYGNHKPVVRGTDDGIWRRIRLIPFKVKIPKPEQDPDLPKKLKEELPGILTWAAEGCLKWQESGLGEPEAVLKATATYREEMDVLQGFLTDCCVLKPDAQARAGKLYKVYKRWCEENGEKQMTGTKFGRELPERGFEKEYDRRGTYYVGVGIKADVAMWLDEPDQESVVS